MNYAKTFFIGRLVKEPLLKSTSTGMTVAQASIAISEKYKDKEKSHFFDLTAFGKTSELLGKYCGKGRLLHVECKPQLDKWQDKDGSNKQKVTFIIENFTFLDKQKTKTNQPQQNNEYTNEQLAKNEHKIETQTEFANDEIPF